MELSSRLQQIADAVTIGNRVADIGTDHGYVPIYLVSQGICPSAIAADINKGPVKRAEEHIREQGLGDRIETRIGDGLNPLSPEETDTVVIAGMGGELMCHILSQGIQFLLAGKEFVLSPQSETFKVRHFLHEHGYQIEKEWFLKDEGKYYLVMRAVPGEEHYSREEDYLYGHLLLAERNPVLLEYLEIQLGKDQKILAHLEKGKPGGEEENPQTRHRRKELHAEIERLTAILTR